MTKKLITTIAVLAVLLTALSVVFAQDPEIEDVCLVTDVGKVDDGTFNEFAYQGMIAAAEDFDLENDYIETIAPTDYEPNIQRCIDSGYDAVITVGFLLQDATLAAAEANPDVYFIGIDQGYEAAPENLVAVQFHDGKGRCHEEFLRHDRQTDDVPHQGPQSRIYQRIFRS